MLELLIRKSLIIMSILHVLKGEVRSSPNRAGSRTVELNLLRLDLAYSTLLTRVGEASETATLFDLRI